MFKILAEQGKARYGVLKTKTGSYETPFFMPVATKASVKYINSKDLGEIGIKTIIANALILFLRPGLDVIKRHKGIHNFMNFKECIFTDSGGFQILNKAFLIKSDDNGAYFRSPFDGKKHFLTPEEDIRIQEIIGADVMMALDNVPHYGTSKEHIENCVNLTTQWAKRCKEAHKSNQLLFGIAQGGIYKDVRELSTKQIVSLDFDGIALGGLCIGEERKDMYKMINLSKKIIPKEKPIYIMGVGTPHDIIECVSEGIDIFDSRLPARNARHGNLFTKNGAIDITKKKYLEDTKPIEKDCQCFTCKNYSRAYISYLLKQNEGSGLRLATIHNLYFINKLMERIREEIKKGTFNKFKKTFLKTYRFKEERGLFSYSSK